VGIWIYQQGLFFFRPSLKLRASLSARLIMGSSRRIALVAILSVIVFVSKSILPPPEDDAFVFIQAMVLLLSTFYLGVPGATYVSTLSGVLKALITGGFAPFTIGLGLLYGLLVDGFVVLLKAAPKDGRLSYRRVIGAATVSTAIEGIVGYTVTVPLFQLAIPSSMMIDLGILVGGIVSGLIGGWLAAFAWKRYLAPKPGIGEDAEATERVTASPETRRHDVAK
jgi:hypothetical protein